MQSHHSESLYFPQETSNDEERITRPRNVEIIHVGGSQEMELAILANLVMN